jgi:rhodanese-related sulfurtransferase
MMSFLNAQDKSSYSRSAAFNDEIEEYINHTVPVISVFDLQNCTDQFVILDAREQVEYNISHIKNAKHVGYDQFDINKLEGINKSDKIVLYCSIGYRSEKIGEKVLAAGYKNVFNLYGSIFEWVNMGNTLVNNENKPTKMLHTYNQTWSKWIVNKAIEKVW